MEVIFLVFILVCLVAHVYILVNIHRFNLRYFKSGIIIFKRTIKRTYCRWNNKDGVYSMRIANFVFIPEMRIGYFVTKFKMFKQSNLFFISRGLPLTIFGEFYENNNQVEIIFKVSYGVLIPPVLLMLFVLTIITMAIREDKFEFVLFGISIILIIVLVIYVLYRFQKEKMLSIENELQTLI
ncbi:hypothetical protein EYV94_23410 [Puteibacter caeruleilacunae]|nr:hypothetical protein EYV94_23410 [Puteibacter caeruleilacunae]